MELQQRQRVISSNIEIELVEVIPSYHDFWGLEREAVLADVTGPVRHASVELVLKDSRHHTKIRRHAFNLQALCKRR